MKEYYQNCDPDEVENDKPICDRRILHIVSTALSFETLKDAIAFTFDDHPIIPKLIRNPNAKLDELLKETNQTFTSMQMNQMKELEGFSGFEKVRKTNLPNILDLIGWVIGYCARLTLFLRIFNKIILYSLSIVICW